MAIGTLPPKSLPLPLPGLGLVLKHPSSPCAMFPVAPGQPAAGTRVSAHGNLESPGQGAVISRMKTAKETLGAFSFPVGEYSVSTPFSRMSTSAWWRPDLSSASRRGTGQTLRSQAQGPN